MEVVKAEASDRVSGREGSDAFHIAGWIAAPFSLLLFLIFVSGATFGKSKPLLHGVNREYVEALAAANRFLHAWQTQDHEGGLLMLSDEGKRHFSEDHLEKFFSKPSNVIEAYEVSRAKKVKSGHYVFPVTLFEVVDGRKVHPRYSEVVVIRTGKDDWAIDKLP